MITAEKHDEQPKVVAVTHAWRDENQDDVMNQGNRIHQWVRKVVEPSPLFDPRKEKETYQQERK
jgi:hypothetical protein